MKKTAHARARAILGAVLMRPSLHYRIKSALPIPAMFGEAHTAAAYVYGRGEAGQAFDAADARDHLGPLVDELIQEACTADLLEDYARGVRDHYLAAQEAAICATTINRLNSGADYWQTRQQAEAERGVLMTMIGTTSASTVAARAMAIIEAGLHDDGGRSVLSGFSSLDGFCRGWHPGEMIIVGALPGIGKTTLLAAFALNAAQVGRRVAYYSMGDMVAEQIFMKMQSLYTGIHFDKILYSNLSADEFRQVAQAAEYLDSLSVEICDIKTIAPTAGAIRDHARLLKDNSGLDLIITDYIQQVGDVERSRDEYSRVSNVSRHFKQTAVMLDVPHLVASQLSRMEKHEIPTMRKMRGSGAIEQDADVIITPFQAKNYLDAGPDEQARTDVHFLKSRASGDKLPYIGCLYWHGNRLNDRPSTDYPAAPTPVAIEPRKVEENEDVPF